MARLVALLSYLKSPPHRILYVFKSESKKLNIIIWNISFQNAQNHTTYVKERDALANRSVTPSGYEYHIKTIAIIEGSNPIISVNDVLNSDPNAHSVRHRISKRSINSTTASNSTRASDLLIPSASVQRKNVTLSNATVPEKGVTKRHSSYPYPNKRQQPGAEMTQAIMEDTPNSDVVESAYRRSSTYPLGDEDYDIENFFRKNVPIYDGVPIARKGRFRNQQSKRYHQYSPVEDEDEEEEEKPMKGLLEVHPHHDSEYEYVPMTVDEFGKQVVLESDADDEEEDPPRYSHASKYPSSYSDDDYHNIYNKPNNHPYRFEPAYSSFKASEPDHSNSFSDSSPKYGTSHQYNSLSDDQPRYYKHFSSSLKSHVPSSPYDEEDRTSHSFPSNTHQVHKSPHFHNNHDFVPVRGSLKAPYSGQYPPRTTHVPKTLEEYHRIHGHFKEYKNSPRPYSPSRPIIVPQDDKEEDEDEKDTDSTAGPKSFVSLNFGTGLSSDDDGVSIRHQIGHFKPKYPYFGGQSEYDHQNVEFPAESVTESSAKFSDSAASIKSFVDSVFKQNDNVNFRPVPDTIIGKKIQPVSPYNPHFGDRVKQKAAPSQNILWHRKSSPDTRVARDKLSRNKNDRSLQEENMKIYDNLVKEVNLKPTKRDVDEKETETPHESAEEEENVDETDPPDTQAKAEDEHEEDGDDTPQVSYWSQTSLEPN